MRIHATGLVIGAALLVGLAGCGGGDTGATTTEASPVQSVTSAAPTPSVEADTTQGCDVADSTGSTTNTELQAFADAQFQALDCADSAALTDQLRALVKTQEFKDGVADQGWTSDSGEALGGVSVSITDLNTRSACRITVIDSPARAKTMDCQDV